MIYKKGYNNMFCDNNFDTALEEFGKALGNLKREYAKEYCKNVNELMVIIDEDDYINIIPTVAGMREMVFCREWVNTKS